MCMCDRGGGLQVATAAKHRQNTTVGSSLSLHMYGLCTVREAKAGCWLVGWLAVCGDRGRSCRSKIGAGFHKVSSSGHQYFLL